MCVITKPPLSARESHDYCLLCGDKNPWSQQLSFTATDDGGVHATFQGRPELQGYDGILHGGVICALPVPQQYLGRDRGNERPVS